MSESISPFKMSVLTSLRGVLHVYVSQLKTKGSLCYSGFSFLE